MIQAYMKINLHKYLFINILKIVQVDRHLNLIYKLINPFNLNIFTGAAEAFGAAAMAPIGIIPTSLMFSVF